MIFLMDQYGSDTKLLDESLRAAGYDIPRVCVMYDGYLPDDVASPYAYYAGRESGPHHPLYFDRIAVPAYWEITGTGNGGEILDESELRGRIFYAEPKHKRYVRIIDWLDRSGRVRCSDHYDCYGRRFAQTILDEKQKTMMKVYFAPDQTEKIVENFVTGHIILHDHGKTMVFRNKSEFVVHFLHEVGYNLDRILYNSLSTPFFVSQRLGRAGFAGRDILFWQEKVGEETPGNMLSILRGDGIRTKHIAVQNQEAFDILAGRHPEALANGVLHKLGYIYAFEEGEKERNHALVLTNSDQVEHLELLLRRLPNWSISVAALTEMSSRLLDLGRYSNLKLYPEVKTEQVEKLLQISDVYLDINRGNEILNGTFAAFKHKLLIMGWEETIHNKQMTDAVNIVKLSDSETFIHALEGIEADRTQLAKRLEEQSRHAMVERPESYREFLESVC